MSNRFDIHGQHEINAEVSRSLADAPEDGTKPRILLVANTAWYLHNFRKNLAMHLLDLGADVSMVSPRDQYTDLLEEAGIPWIEWQVNRRGINPLNELSSVSGLREIYRRERPNLIHHFTIKCNIYGTIASRGLKDCRLVNTVTGLGHTFLSDSARCRAVRPIARRLYRWALTRKNVRPMFQNQDDARFLLGERRYKRSAPAITMGSGVDLQQFAPTSDSVSNETGKPLRVLFVGRIVKEKGISEFVEAANTLREEGVRAEFLVCGERDGGNRSVIDDETYATWLRQDVVQFLGHQDDIASIMRTVDLVVLPSYREGTPRVLLEASAMGLPIVATDVPGCRDVALEGKNALLVPPRDPEALAVAIAKLLTNEELRTQLGEGAFELSKEFDVKRVNQQIVDAYTNFDDRQLRSLAKPSVEAGMATPQPVGV